MITSIIAACAMHQSFGKGSDCPQAPGPTVIVGWGDELNSRTPWGDLGIENRARVSGPPGIFLLSLGHVPSGWPYTFQWSGVTRPASIDIARFPVILARVTWVKGYAHMDIDVVDSSGKVVKGFRSTTLTSPGLSVVDLGAVLDPAIYSLRLRLIVGGENSGCEATYDWVRFVSRQDADLLAKYPDWPKIRYAWATGR